MGWLSFFYRIEIFFNAAVSFAIASSILLWLIMESLLSVNNHWDCSIVLDDLEW